MRNIKALSISLISSIGIVTLFTVIEGLSAPFGNIMGSLTGNPWITQSIIGIVSFAIISVILSYTTKPDNVNSAKYIWSVFFTALAGTVILVLFFTFNT